MRFKVPGGMVALVTVEFNALVSLFVVLT